MCKYENWGGFFCNFLNLQMCANLMIIAIALFIYFNTFLKEIYIDVSFQPVKMHMKVCLCTWP